MYVGFDVDHKHLKNLPVTEPLFYTCVICFDVWLRKALMINFVRNSITKYHVLTTLRQNYDVSAGGWKSRTEVGQTWLYLFLLLGSWLPNFCTSHSIAFLPSEHRYIWHLSFSRNLIWISLFNTTCLPPLPWISFKWYENQNHDW